MSHYYMPLKLKQLQADSSINSIDTKELELQIHPSHQDVVNSSKDVLKSNNLQNSTILYIAPIGTTALDGFFIIIFFLKLQRIVLL